MPLQVVAVVKGNSEEQLVRKKREWILPPRPLMENKDYTGLEYIAKIRSDFESQMPIEYSLEGIGANLFPFHVFTVDQTNGYIKVSKILDREEIDTYNLFGIAKTTGGEEKEKKIGIRIEVLDENDNPPVFGIINQGEVKELSEKDTFVMKINATDRDKEGTDNSKIAFSILSQSPSDDMFYVTPDGSVWVKQSNLDREKGSQYTLTVIGKDLNGKPGGYTGTGTVTINVLDVNDNHPTLELEQYEGSVEENTEGVEVMRIKASDLDVEAINREAVYEIVKGNEGGYFSFKTDSKTNEGILMLDKAVDYENVKNLDLGISVKNKVAHYAGATTVTGGLEGSSEGSAKLKTYPLKINVINIAEGAAFDPKVKSIPIVEGGHSIKVNDIIARYNAIDLDTGKLAENVRYAKGSDPDNWLIIDPVTAEIKLNKLPDRESPYLLNGTYMAKVLCISEEVPGRTATGTVAIQVEDFNDNCPTVTSNFKTMCTTADSVIANAEDKDAFPNGAPFSFKIIKEGTKGEWQVEQLNETAAVLRAQGTVWPGVYQVAFDVKDAQGVACSEPQKVDVQVCTCEDGVECGTRLGLIGKQSALGPAGIGLLLLGLLLLLLIPLLLLVCNCGAAGIPGGFTDMPFDTKSHLINYHTEGQGESTAVPLITMPTQPDGGMVIVKEKERQSQSAGLGFHQPVINIDRMTGAAYGEGHYRDSTWEMMNAHGNGFYSTEMEHRESGVGGGVYEGMALPDHLLLQYYTQKLASGNENLAVEDGVLVHDYEGKGSLAGSVGCCSLLESDNDLQFLDDLGPKFKTLAEVCGGKKIQTEVKPVFIPPPRPAINTQSSVSSVVTTQQLPPLPQPQLTIPQTERTVIKETVKESTVREGMTTVKEGMVNQGQMVMLQQQQQPAVYYTAAPMMQPMHYIVQPQVQNTVLLAEAPATNMQGMVLVNSGQTVPAQGMIVQGQTMMSTAQAQSPGMVLVGGSGIQGGGANLIQTGIPSGSQTMMVVQGKVPAGSMKVLKGGQTSLVQGGTLQLGGFSGSQRVGESSTSAGTQISSTTTTVSTTPTYTKLVTQEIREIP
ncbi:desmoglein-2-like [Notolabrus celidotus]|uniref:desmoglein-2-like n=1 Tax=Notolabrus celidotus TaxID=1203425 RepID=UPI00149086E0|nr:desmoglein-2-like [Notolabrus celidotus]